LFVVFTRTLSQPPTPSIAADAQHLSAEVADTVSAHTNVLVAGNKTGSKKARAEVLGLPVLDEAAWRAHIAKAGR
jgi:DNA ligase (NAD+)